MAVIEERSGSTVNKQYIWGNYIDECIQLRTYATSGAGNLPAGSYYPLQDLLYRTKALADSSGEIIEAYDYDPYGNTLIFSAAGAGGSWWADDAEQVSYAACEVLYAGYRYDAESKTYQVRNRQYNPALGRWIQRDPIGFEGEDWNLYGYVRQHPVNWVDTNGLLRLCCIWPFKGYFGSCCVKKEKKQTKRPKINVQGIRAACQKDSMECRIDCYQCCNELATTGLDAVKSLNPGMAPTLGAANCDSECTAKCDSQNDPSLRSVVKGYLDCVLPNKGDLRDAVLDIIMDGLKGVL